MSFAAFKNILKYIQSITEICVPGNRGMPLKSAVVVRGSDTPRLSGDRPSAFEEYYTRRGKVSRAVGRHCERTLFCGQRSGKGMPTYVIFKAERTYKRLAIKYTFTLQFRNIRVLCLLQKVMFIHTSTETANGEK
jgi:hypothetical protein